MNTRTEKRPWLAALLALFYPGLGHVYLREWLRALLWFGLVVTSSALLIPEGVMPAEMSIEAFLEAARSMPLDAALAMLSITFFSMLDAYWMAKRTHQQQSVEAGTTCPNCGKELDEDIDFCHWCTQPIDAEPSTDGD
ncbi:MAG: hypothetical protein ABEJ85_03525 [Haloarculaceae archaeon]